MTEQLNLWKAALEVAFDQTCSVGRPKDWKLIKDALDSVNAALTHPAPPASQEQAQQPSAQAWANETGLRQIECPSCGDLAVAYDPQQPSGGEVVAYRLRDDEASERYGKDVFVYWSANEFRDHPSKPKLLALIEPLTIATPKPEPMTWQPIETAPKDGSDVLVCSTQCVGRFAVASWDGEEWRDMGDIGWAGMDGGGNQPTHWMPIPPAPITKGEA